MALLVQFVVKPHEIEALFYDTRTMCQFQSDGLLTFCIFDWQPHLQGSRITKVNVHSWLLTCGSGCQCCYSVL